MTFHLLPHAVAQYGCREANVLAEAFDGFLGAVGLDKVDGRAQQDDNENNGGIHGLAQEGRNQTCHEQDHD